MFFCIFVEIFLSKQYFVTAMPTTIEELQAIVAQSVLDTQAFKAQLAVSQEAADRRAAEADRRSKEIDKQIKELGKQIGGLGNTFGSFTESLLLPSVEKILAKPFGVTSFTMRMKSCKGEEWMELDGFGFVNGALYLKFR